MAHAQKPDFVFWRKGRVHLNQRGVSVQSTTGSRGVRISGSNTMDTPYFGVVEGYWLPTPFASFPFPSPPVCHRVPSHFNWILAGYRRFGIASVPSSRVKQPKNTPEDGTGQLSRHDGYYQPTLRNIPEKRRSQLHRGGSLKSRIFIAYFVNFVDAVSCSDCTQPKAGR